MWIVFFKLLPIFFKTIDMVNRSELRQQCGDSKSLLVRGRNNFGRYGGNLIGMLSRPYEFITVLLNCYL